MVIFRRSHIFSVVAKQPPEHGWALFEVGNFVAVWAIVSVTTSLPFTFSSVVSTPPRPRATPAQENQSPTSPSCEGNLTCTEANLVPSRPEQSYCCNVREYSTTGTHRGTPYDYSGGGIAQGSVNRSASSPHSPSSTPVPSPSLRSSLRPDGTLSLFPADPGAEEPLDSSVPSSGVPLVVALSVPEPWHLKFAWVRGWRQWIGADGCGSGGKRGLGR